MRNAEFFTRVQTGHSAGRITISLREADTVKREKTRVQFDEPQRTLVGHFRHELGHYIWDRLVSGRDENRFRQLIAYEAAMARHHSQGPIGNWQLAIGSGRSFRPMRRCTRGKILRKRSVPIRRQRVGSRHGFARPRARNLQPQGGRKNEVCRFAAQTVNGHLRRFQKQFDL